MRSSRIWSLFVFTVVFAFTLAAKAQDAPPAGAPQGGGQAGPPRGPRGPRPAPTNLKVLPKTMTGDQVGQLMRTYEGDLGVQCEYCHAQNPATHRIDFPSDANPMKDKARAMITMTEAINAKYLAELPNRKYADMPVTCGTCHRGEAHPSTFVPKPQARPGGPAPGAGPPPPA